MIRSPSNRLCSALQKDDYEEPTYKSKAPRRVSETSQDTERSSSTLSEEDSQWDLPQDWGGFGLIKLQQKDDCKEPTYKNKAPRRVSETTQDTEPSSRTLSEEDSQWDLPQDWIDIDIEGEWDCCSLSDSSIDTAEV
jgi:hypothetical protein